MIDDPLLNQFIAIVGAANALTNVDDLTHYTHENRDIYIGKTPLVLKPKTKEEVSQIVKLAAQTETAIVPQGGHTGHVGGGVPDESGTQIVVSMSRMNAIRTIDLSGNTLTCEAGCILENIQKAADENDRLFPLSLAAQGSCQIGGNIGTNAGGTGVLAYGNTRDLVMGLEVVLPSGEIWNGLRSLKKDNTGYSLKNLFVGSEGTLGIVTAAVLKLFPKPKGKATAICGLATPEQAISLFEMASAHAGSELTAFEFMSKTALDFTFRHFENLRNPLAEQHDWQVLIEISSSRSIESAEGDMQSILERALEKKIISDAAIATSTAQQTDFWKIRETMPTAQRYEGASIKHDISLPLNCMAEFIGQAGQAVRSLVPGIRACTFGHLGDGNLHYNFSQPEGMDRQNFMALQSKVNETVHSIVAEMEGSVAAEHGVGRLKRDLLAKTKDPAEMMLMRSIKQAIDPQNIMNPGKIV